MSKIKKMLLFVFAIAVVINLQFSTPITTGMENGFTLEQLADNVFVADAFASYTGSECFFYPDHNCEAFYIGPPYIMWVCVSWSDRNCLDL